MNDAILSAEEWETAMSHAYSQGEWSDPGRFAARQRLAFHDAALRNLVTEYREALADLAQRTDEVIEAYINMADRHAALGHKTGEPFAILDLPHIRAREVAARARRLLEQGNQ